MANSSSILDGRDVPTTAVRVPTLTRGNPADFPTLPSLPHIAAPGAFGSPTASIQVPGYDVLSELGRGGMGVVYLARHHRLDRLVALKMVIARQYAGRDEQIRFRQEVEAAAKLNHPNIAQVYEVGDHEGFAYAAFEYVAGGTLLQWQKQTPQPPREAARLALALAHAVQHAHDHGIIHRDLKPANILMANAECGGRNAESKTSSSTMLSLSLSNPTVRISTAELFPKVTDFGLAKKLNQESDLTATGMACGTPNYMAPEQIHGKQGHVGVAADVYGLGALLFELLTGRSPFRGETPLDTMQAVLNDPAPSVKSLVPRTPQDLAVITAKCLEKDPAQRYPSARGLAEDLERYLDNRPILARGVGHVERCRRWMQRNPYPTALMATLLVGIVTTVALAVQFWHTAESERRTHGVLMKTLEAEQAARIEATEARARAEMAERVADQKRIEAVAAGNLANKCRVDAETSQKAAEASKKDALGAANIAAKARDKATESLDMSLSLAELFLQPVANDIVFLEGEHLSQRLQLISDAYKHLEIMNQQNPNTPSIQHAMRRTEFRFGQLAAEIGKAGLAMHHFLWAQEGVSQLADANPEHLGFQRDGAKFTLDCVAEVQRLGMLNRINAAVMLQSAARAIDRCDRIETDEFCREFHNRTYRRRHAMLRAVNAEYQEPHLRAELIRTACDNLPPLPNQMVKTQRIDVDLAGEVLRLRAELATSENDPSAWCYFEEALNLYDQARGVWFVTFQCNRWDVRWLSIRFAMADYLERTHPGSGQQHLEDCRKILLQFQNNAQPLAVGREELAMLIQQDVRRRLNAGKYDPRPEMVRIENILRPTWTMAGPDPGDRTRALMADCSVIIADWYSGQNLHQEAGMHHMLASERWGYALTEQILQDRRPLVARSAAAAAMQFAKANDRQNTLKSMDIAYRMDANDGMTVYRLARARALLAASPIAKPEDDAEALRLLVLADRLGQFKIPSNREHYEKASELDPFRKRFTPSPNPTP